mmetsp:Transcript_1744/g.3821  ORF Transcript_1744/g.3821 Transcript_1744/m.3821 type:complete len:706 (+) Transcript_1744:99-2216(+)
MMQRKKIAGAGLSATSSNDINDGLGSSLSPPAPSSMATFDDGGAAKRKSSHPFAGPSKAFANFSAFCLPGVPAALKAVILSFLGFVALILLTAGREKHHRHHRQGLGSAANHGGKSGLHNGMLHGIPHAPESLHSKLRHTFEKQIGGSKSRHHDSSFQTNGDANDRSASIEASQRMLEQPSRFVDSEKKLKQQLRQLLERQNAEKRETKKMDSESILGVKISNRYLGDDLLPYPESKAKEDQWIQHMEKRKEELRTLDEKEWNEIMQKYEEIMQEFEHHDSDPDLNEQENTKPDDEISLNHPALELPPKAVSSPEDVDSGSSFLSAKKWPSPTEKAGENIDILLKPAFGVHNPASNAVFVFAEGYDLSIYLALVESLVNSGFNGDLVLSISNEEKLKPGVKDYLMSKTFGPSAGKGVNVVAYEVEWTCFNKSTGEPVHGAGEGIHHCQMNSAFGDSSTGNFVPDPREPRPVATARYELYWMWSLKYKKESWIMLIDARDVWFQLDPFEGLSSSGVVTNDETGDLMGELRLFGENADAVRIGTSNYNRNWLIQAYGRSNVSQYFEEPVICSGSTMGHQVAIETYLRAMVAEFDATSCKSKGCDQGFHNYLYYSGKLGKEGSGNHVEGISKVIVQEQGKGIINNLAALREKTLQEWGLYDPSKELVLNWDGSTSAVAHQYDRDKEVNLMVKGKKKIFEENWNSSKKK